jgi:hypothetical protein
MRYSAMKRGAWPRGQALFFCLRCKSGLWRPECCAMYGRVALSSRMMSSARRPGPASWGCRVIRPVFRSVNIGSPVLAGGRGVSASLAVSCRGGIVAVTPSSPRYLLAMGRARASLTQGANSFGYNHTPCDCSPETAGHFQYTGVRTWPLLLAESRHGIDRRVFTGATTDLRQAMC